MHAIETAATRKSWRVFIVEDDSDARAFFEQCVCACNLLEWAGSCGTVSEALGWLACAAVAPDVLLVDLGLPDGSGLEVIGAAITCFPCCEPLVVSVFGDETNLLASIEAGALGYIQKDAAPQDISQTIVEMKLGASPISPMLARRVLQKYRSDRQAAQHDRTGVQIATSAVPSAQRSFLSRREHEVLELIARGFSYSEIARLRALSVNTVQTHIKNLYSKLSVHSKNEAVYEATRLGLLEHPI